MMKMTRLLIPAIMLVTLLVSSLLPTSVFAIAQPSSPPAVNAAILYTNVLETGDIGVFVDYFLDYPTIPTTETATLSYLVIFVDDDGVTQLKSVSPYAYIASGHGGYDRGAAWIYFTAAEVTAYGIAVADAANYRVWVAGNPTVTSGWTGDPPKTSSSIYWTTSGSPATLLAIRIMALAPIISVVWGFDLTQTTPLGVKLSTFGEEYFANVIPNLATIAPSVFSSISVTPTNPGTNFTTSFGAILSAGTGTAVGAPITFASGNTTVTVNPGSTGTLILTLAKGTIGTVFIAAGQTATVTGTPLVIGPGTNTIICTVAGTFSVSVYLSNTQTKIDANTTGTMFDMSGLATAFGTTKEIAGGLVWLLIAVLVCAAVYKTSDRNGLQPGKITLILFDLCIIGGALLGMLPLLIATLLFLFFGVFIGYVVFFRPANV